MNYNKNKILVIMILIILIIIPLDMYYNYTKEEVIVGYLTDNYQDREILNKMKFDAVFGTPYYSNYKSYRYYNDRFVKSGKYVNTDIDEVNVDKLNWIIDEYEDIDSYKDMKKMYGPIKFTKTIGDHDFFVFDGKTQKYDKNGYKLNTIFIHNNKDSTYEKMELETHDNFEIRDVVYYEDIIYVIGTSTNIINDKAVNKMIEYKINGDNVERKILHKSSFYYNKDAIYTVDNILYFEYDESDKQILMSINLDNENIIKSVELGETTSWKIYEINKIKSILYYNDTLYVFCKGDSNTVDVIEFDRYLNLKKYYNLEFENYSGINKTFVFEDEIYIVIEETSVHASIYRINDEKMEKLIMFGLNIQKYDLFYYDLFLND